MKEPSYLINAKSESLLYDQHVPIRANKLVSGRLKHDTFLQDISDIDITFTNLNHGNDLPSFNLHHKTNVCNVRLALLTLFVTRNKLFAI